ncbi:hypothetical protein QYF36_025628 [Acer negundo]|nr:hypothetical protein QYF36_025628 [Acer negundo]
MVETREFFDLPAMQHKDYQGLAPRRATDPGWAHGTMVNGGRQKIKCKYCHKIFLGGGISRLKQHLAGERGNVAPCEEVPEDVKLEIQQHLDFKVSEKLKRQKGLKSNKNSSTPCFEGMEEEGDDNNAVQIQKPLSVLATSRRRGKEIVEGASNRTKKRKKQNLAAATPVVGLPLRQNFASQESIYEADMAVARFMYDAGLPFSAANSCFFQQMADAIAAVGPGYKMPSYQPLRSKLLNKVAQDAGVYSEELKRTWEVTGCSDHLHQMFTGKAWIQSSFSKQRAGLEVAEIVTDPLFWSFCDQTLKVTKPLLSVLHLMESEERPSVGYIYDAMEKAKKSIVEAFDDKEFDLMPYLKVIDHKWQEEFHSPLHAAAYYLNPSVFYNPSFSSNKVIQKGLLDCIETLEPNLSAQVLITNHINVYEEAKGDFGRPVALRGRESLAPATWWSLYAVDCPELQRLAIRILSQTCSITRCRRNWSMFERIHSKKRNRLEHQRLNDLMFVHNNLHLQQRRAEAVKAKCSKGTLDPICLEAMDANIGDWVEDMGSMEGEDLSWMDVSVPSERTFFSHEVQNMDDSVDSTENRSSNATKGIDGSDDL